MPPGLGLADSLFTSCKKGDFNRIKYLVEKQEVNLNVRDCWDSTPLYYACHRGYPRIVEYLLANGARCEANTFDGERCLYGALDDGIRRVLLNYKVINAGNKKWDDYDKFCERMLKAEEFSDFTLYLEDINEDNNDKEFKLHRCILAARSEYFSKMFENKWKAREIRTSAIHPDDFKEFVKFVYTGRFTVDRDFFETMCMLSDRCKIRNLTEYLKVAHNQAIFYEVSKRRVKFSTLALDSPECRNDLSEDYGSLIDTGIPEEYLHMERAKILNPFHDLCLQVDGQRFYCNKVFVCSRSEYFSALIQDHFLEYQEENGISIFTLRTVKPAVLTCVLHYIYTNSPNLLSQDVVLEVLEAAAVYLLPGLKKCCGNFLCGLISLDSVMDFFQIARVHDLSKLEDSCCAFIADNIEIISKRKEFHNFIILDAKNVQDRQETDSIAIIDDIRYHLFSEKETSAELKEVQEKLKIIDNLLKDLNLEA